MKQGSDNIQSGSVWFMGQLKGSTGTLGVVRRLMTARAVSSKPPDVRTMGRKRWNAIVAGLQTIGNEMLIQGYIKRGKCIRE